MPATEHDAPAALPRTLEKYRLERLLSSGGMGRVYVARIPGVPRPVAVKVLHPPGRFSPKDRAERLARFRREIAALGRIDHPHVVLATDTGEADGELFLVTELIDGLSLQTIADRLGPLPAADCAELCRQVAVGLGELERLGLVHRDVKPSNLMLDRAGVVKLLDFGLVRFLTDGLPQENDPEPTPTGVLLGTFDYLAPEQALAARAIDSRTDVYSLGCTLYRLLEGRVPYGGDGYVETTSKLKAHVTGPFPEVGRPDVPAGLRDLLRRMVAPSRDARPGPAEVEAGLRLYSAGHDLAGLLRRAEAVAEDAATAPFVPPSTHRAGPTVATPRPVFHERPPRAAVLVALALLLVPLGLLAWALLPVPKPAEPEPTLRDLDALEAGKVHDVLAWHPYPRVWHRDGGEALLKYQADKGLLHVISPGHAVLLFGTTRATDYTFAVDLIPPKDHGELHVVVGYHDLPRGANGQGDSPEVAGYQYVEPVRTSGVDGVPWKVHRGVRTVEPDPILGLRIGLVEQKAGVVNPAPARETVVRVTVAQGRVATVEINGKECPGLLRVRGRELNDPAWARGGLGIGLQSASGVFINASFQRKE